jgi:hypothetical protein
VIGIPLRDVVAFLRPRGALGILEGAPLIWRGSRLSVATVWASVDTPAHDESSLYLGDGEICPAAEGWAIRALLILLGIVPEVIKQGGLFGVAPEGVALYWPAGGGGLDRQVWSWCPVHVAGWRTMYEPRTMPASPAERLAAVLRYELGRAP